MTVSRKPAQQTYMALHQPLLAMTTLGVLAEEASRHFGDLIRLGPNGERIATKLDGYATAAYWRESSAVWVNANPSARVTWGEGYEGGWPEFLVQGRYHVIPHRSTSFKKSARQKALDYGTPDKYMSFPANPLPSLSIEELQPEARQKKLLVRVFAVRDKDEHMISTRVVAPAGKEVRWAFDITEEEVSNQKAEWLLSEVTWLEDISILGSLVLPSVALPQLPPPAAAASAAAGVAVGAEAPRSPSTDSPRAPHFPAGPDTQRPPAAGSDEASEVESGGTSSTGTDQ